MSRTGRPVTVHDYDHVNEMGLPGDEIDDVFDEAEEGEEVPRDPISPIFSPLIDSQSV